MCPRNSSALTGQLARPAGKPCAAIVVFPTIMNQAPNALRRLPMLAEAGTLAFCADLCGRQPADREDAHVRDFAMATKKYGIALATPAQFLRRSK